MFGVKKESHRIGWKRTSGPQTTIKGIYQDDDGSTGVKCPACGNWTEEIDGEGFCKDDWCRHDRIVKALLKGEAMRLADGTIVWTPGVKIRELMEKAQSK